MAELEDAIYNSEYAEKYSEITDADFERRIARDREVSVNANDLYINTAGEIEARDSAKRRNFTGKQKKNTRPDIDKTDVVFAEGVSYSTEKANNSLDYSYEALIRKPDMKLAVVDSNVPQSRSDIVVQAKKNAASIGKINGAGGVTVPVNDIGIDVVVGTKGLRHSLDRRLDVNGPVTLKAGEILQNSIRINELTPELEGADASYVLIGAARKDSGELYIVRSVVNRHSSNLVSMDVLYAINAKKENRLRSMRPGFLGPVTDSVISISDLLDYVNQYFPDILPESVGCTMMCDRK